MKQFPLVGCGILALGLALDFGARIEAATVRGEVLDASTGKRIASRVYVEGAAGAWFFVEADAGGTAVRYDRQSSFSKDAIERHVTLSADPFHVELAPGAYTFTVERGKEYRALTQRVEVGSEPVQMRLTLERWVDMGSRGWYSGDTHVHRDPAELSNVILAEDVNVALPIVDWTTTDNVAPSDSRRGFRGEFRPEPVVVDATHVYYPRNTEYEIFTTAGKSHTLGAIVVVHHAKQFDVPVFPLERIAERAHAEGGLIDLEKHNWPWSMALVPLLGVDLYELANNHHWRVEFSVRDWADPAPPWMGLTGSGSTNEKDWTLYGFLNYYALLDCGFRLRPAAGTANGVHPVPLGFSRVYVRVDGEFTFAKWMDALKEGRSFVSTGPMLLCEVDGMTPGHRFDLAAGARPTARVQGTVLSDREVRAVEIIVNGEIAQTVPLAARKNAEGAFEAAFRADVVVTGSSWIAARCWEDRPGGRVRFAHTGPVYFDRAAEPIRPRREEADFLVERVKSEIARSGSLLPPEVVAEYKKSLSAYEAVAKLARPAVGSLPVVPAPTQPLGANVRRLLDALQLLGQPLPLASTDSVRGAVDANDATALQHALDPHVLVEVEINPESRVKARRGPAPAPLQQAGYRVFVLKILNHSTVTKELRITSPQAGPVFAGMSRLSAERMQRLERGETEAKEADPKKFLDVALFAGPPMAAVLSGLEVEYALALIYTRDAGRLEGTLEFDVGQGSQDAGFRAEVPVLFDARPAVPVTLHVLDHDASPTVARFVFRDAAGHVVPPQAKRLAPDFYFQEQVYREDGETVLLPPGEIEMEYGRGPEYLTRTRRVEVSGSAAGMIDVRLERWVDPAEHGYYVGDHHIHGAGCAHYTSPTEGVTPADMLRQVLGEGLNVGCVLTWGPCFDYQKRFFSPGVDQLSRPRGLLKYDLEISGFGSEALGHVVLLNLKQPSYPGSEGTKTKGWPRWTTPVLRWAKAQGGYVGYAHSASGLEVSPKKAAARLLEALDGNGDHLLTPQESVAGLLPEPFARVDADRDGALAESELVAAADRAADRLPNLAVPEMDGVGAMEVCVSTALGACDFMSAMDTPRIAEWNMWYHILDCGFPLKLSGETDFPCMSGDRVGAGRVYVRLGKLAPESQLDFPAWCEALARGRSYVSDGYAHALEFTVGGAAPGGADVQLAAAGRVPVEAVIAFAPVMPRTVAQGGITPPGGRRWLGDTVTLHGPRARATSEGGVQRVEIVVNGRAIASDDVPADGKLHALHFEVEVGKSSWVALRSFPQLHTNPVNVLVAGKPIRASRSSALWCAETIRQLWGTRGRVIPPEERSEARAAFDEALRIFARIAEESPAEREE